MHRMRIGIIAAYFIAGVLILSGQTARTDITVVYNNVPGRAGLETRWGLAVVIQGLERTILFDTGGEGTVLLYNLKQLRIAAGNIEAVVLSHIHRDHTGGLMDFLQAHDRVTVYIPHSFPSRERDAVTATGARVMDVDTPQKVCERAWTTGELGTHPKEQSLVIDTHRGLVVITGCAHPGVVRIARFVKNHFKKEIYLIMGGFHLGAYSEEQVRDIIKGLKGLDVQKVGPSHCTGRAALELFKQAWGDDFIDLGCGARITIPGK